MTSRSNPSFSNLTAVGLIAMTCVLAGCGRKAGLDLPPTASSAQNSADAADVNAANAAAATNQNSAGNLSSQIYRAPGSGIAVAPRGEKKRIPLDVILD